MRLRVNKSIPTLGEFLRDLRKREGLSLRAAAARLSVHFAYVADVELGKRDPSDALLQKLANLYSVDIEDFRKLDSRIPLDELRQVVKECPAIGLELKRLLGKVNGGKLLPEKLAQSLAKVS